MVASTEPCEGFVGSIHAASSSSDDPRPCLYASSPASARPADHPSRIEPSSPVHSADTAPRRVAYIWSSSLERLSSALPSNPDRSMHVHSLIRVMDMLDLGDPSPDFQMEGGSVGHDTHAASWDAPLVPRSSSDRGSKARVVMPDLQLGQRGWLERYHSPRYIDHIFSLGDGGPDGQGSTSSSGSDTGSTSSSDGSDDHPRKRRRINASKSSKYGLQHDCPPFPSLPDYMTHIAAATSTACRLVACGAYSIAINWDGGRHHAHRSKASGFCYIADVQLGIMLLLKEGKPREKQQAAIHESASAGDCRQDVDGAVAASIEMSARADVESGRDGSGSSTEVVGVKDMPEERTAMKGSAEPPRKPSRKPRVMYLDLDLHYGDGVASAFHSPAVYPYIQDPHQERCTTHDTAHDADTIDLPTTSGSVPLVGPTPKSSQSHTKPPRQPKPSKMPKAPNTLTLSLHHSSPLFFPPPSPLSLLPAPSTPHPFSLSIPLRAYPSGKTYAALWPSIERVKEAYDPDYVVLQLGVDGFQGDPVGKYGNWSTHGEGGALWVVERVKEWGRGLVVLGGGGYGDGRGAARAWAGATGVLLGRDMSSDIDIPHHDHFTSYAPNYTIEVPPGNAKDENTPEYIAEVSATYEIIARRIADIVRGPPT